MTEPGRDRERADVDSAVAEVPALAVDPLLDRAETRIVVCCGSGGVGKTTTAAALGLRAAERGRRVVVLTIDPARRLAQSMGLAELDNVPRRVPGIDGTAGGELFAMMLDMKRTFDETVEEHADPERARAILENPFYQSLSTGFAGTQEYMAMEKLGQLVARDEWDLIVVDTPPSRSALDFLDAPQRLGSFLDGRFIRVLMGPAKAGGRAGRKVMDLGLAGLSRFTGTIDRVVGAGLVRDVQNFVAALDTMFGGFRTRADATYRLLQAPGTAFLVVAAPERDALREAAYFVERLAADRMPLAGLVLNRVHTSGASGLSAERALAAAETLEAKNLAPPGMADDPTGQTETERTTAQESPSPADSGRDRPPGRRSPETHSSTGSSPTADEAAGHETAGERTVDAPADSAHADGADPMTADLLAAALLRVHAEHMRQLARENRTRARFTALHPEVPVVEVAALPGDVHDLDGLRTIGAALGDSAP
ncbi:Anion-transporting ATPase, ArsA/GET3 family [Streptomyces zhaozhouensis]|uniref:Anion-transporting ATPase, ArsA/GET3 family n=1 Tax=Streptomyces zhaozhouensis TaxID=1300267 RepID=A0A286EA32_9ACTN|nr:ArsA family ATPase [Streptomyces zhaozhouensis]SOD67739.1 Anion-transporting ATPase, ArsA/GET3 family [Streptomyces zhaozhouensis]